MLLNNSYNCLYTKVGHGQAFAFFSTDWVRSCDQITCQQTDCPDQFFIHHWLTPHDTTQMWRPTRNGRAEGDRKGPRAGVLGTPAVFLKIFMFYWLVFPPPAHPLPPPIHPHSHWHVPNPHRHVPTLIDTSPTPLTRPPTRRTEKMHLSPSSNKPSPRYATAPATRGWKTGTGPAYNGMPLLFSFSMS